MKYRVLILSLLFVGFFVTNSTAQVGWWKFNNNTNDASGNAYNGTAVGSPTYSTTSKEGTHALVVNGTSQYVNIGTSALFPTGLSPRTMAAWVMTTSVTGARTIFGYGTNSTGQAMTIGLNGTSLQGGAYNDNIDVTNFWATGVWHHVCMTYDGTTAKIYGDGVLLSSVAKTWSLAATSGVIGRSVSGNNYWSGSIDDVRLYNTALTASEVLALASLPPTAPTGLSATTASSSSINLNWTDASTNETGFEIERSTTSGSGFSLVATAAANSTLYTNTGLVVNTTYYYRIRSINTTGSSSYSAEVSATPTLPPPGGIGWWKLDNNANDASGNSYNGTLMNSPTFTTSSKVGTHALVLNGTTQYVNLGNPALFPSGASPRTMSVWATTTSVSGTDTRTIFSYGTANTGQAMTLARTGTSLVGGAWADNFQIANFWAVGVWHHICMTYDGTTAKLYADGVEVASQAKSWNLLKASAYIGRSVSNLQYWDGSIDDARIYNTALTASEVLALASPPSATPTGLAATATSSSSINLNWTDASTNETGFEIERSTTSGSGFALLTTAAANATSNANTGLLGNTTYYYRIRSVNIAGASSYSAEVSATTAPPIQETAWYPLDNDVNDASGNAINGTKVANPLFGNSDKMQGTHALIFDGTASQYVNLGNPPNLPTGANPVTLSAWAKTGIITGAHTILGFGNNVTGQGIFIGSQGQGLVGGGFQDNLIFNGVWDLNVWHHIALTYDGITMRLYADGIEKVSAAKTMNTTLSKAFIGRNVNSSGYWNGRIDDVKIFNSALSAAQILALASTTAPAAPTGLTVQAKSSTAVTLGWTDASSNEFEFQIERSSPTNTNFTVIGKATAGALSFTDVDRTPNTLNYYRIRSTNANGSSAYTTTVSTTTLPVLATAPTAPVTWANLVGVSVDGSNNLTKTAAWSYGNAGATSVQVIPAGQDGWVSTIAEEGNGTRIIGLSSSNVDNGNNMTFGIQLGTNNNIHVVEGGIVVAYVDKYTTGTVFRVERQGTAIQYYVNGVLRYTSLTSSSSSLIVDAGFEDTGSTLKQVQIGMAPVGLTATAASATQIDLNWTDGSTNETGFQIERSLTAGTGFSLISTTAANAITYADASLTIGTTYYYRVRSTNANGSSAYSSEVVATTLSNINSPTGLTATTLSATAIRLNWTDASDNETEFAIERSLTTGSGFSVVNTVIANEITYTDQTVSGGTTYFYRVRAINATGNSAYTTTASATTPVLPAVPSALSANAISPNSVTLTWTDASNNETGFQIVRSLQTGSGFVLVATTNANVSSYSDIGLTFGTSYFYKVRSINAGGTSAFTTELSATTTISSPNGPTNLMLTAVSSTSIKLDWTDASANETGFQIERSLNATSGFTVVTTAAANVMSYIDANLAEDVTYFYRIRSLSAGGNSPYTAVISSTTPVPAPIAPSDLSTVAASPTSVQLTWRDNSTNEVEFEIERSSTFGSGFALVTTVPSNTVAFTDINLATGSTFYYRIRTVNGGGESAYSAEATVRLPIAGANAQCENIFCGENGTVGIGTQNIPTGYRLAVNGKVMAEGVKVALQGEWPDYVFQAGYDLKDIVTLKKYIDDNGHLPNVPSSATVEKEGIDLGEINTVLVEKIEELSLYLIQMEERIKSLEAENIELKKKNKNKQ